MKKGTHGKNEDTFEALNPQGQSRVINAQIQVLYKSIRANVRGLEPVKKQKRKDICIKQLANCIAKIKQL